MSRAFSYFQTAISITRGTFVRIEPILLKFCLQCFCRPRLESSRVLGQCVVRTDKCSSESSCAHSLITGFVSIQLKYIPGLSTQCLLVRPEKVRQTCWMYTATLYQRKLVLILLFFLLTTKLINQWLNLLESEQSSITAIR